MFTFVGPWLLTRSSHTRQHKREVSLRVDECPIAQSQANTLDEPSRSKVSHLLWKMEPTAIWSHIRGIAIMVPIPLSCLNTPGHEQIVSDQNGSVFNSSGWICILKRTKVSLLFLNWQLNSTFWVWHEVGLYLKMWSQIWKYQWTITGSELKPHPINQIFHTLLSITDPE